MFIFLFVAGTFWFFIITTMRESIYLKGKLFTKLSFIYKAEEFFNCVESEFSFMLLKRKSLQTLKKLHFTVSNQANCLLLRLRIKTLMQVYQINLQFAIFNNYWVWFINFILFFSSVFVTELGLKYSFQNKVVTYGIRLIFYPESIFSSF